MQIRACDLPNDLLPAVGDVIERVLKVRMEEMNERKVAENSASIKSCIATVAKEEVALWNRAPVPPKRVGHVESLISKLWGRREYFLKQKLTMNSCKEYKPLDFSALFDISKPSKPAELAADREFLEDQRGPRQLRISTVDAATTSLWQRREAQRHATASSQLPSPRKRGGYPREVTGGSRKEGRHPPPETPEIGTELTHFLAL